MQIANTKTPLDEQIQTISRTQLADVLVKRGARHLTSAGRDPSDSFKQFKATKIKYNMNK